MCTSNLLFVSFSKFAPVLQWDLTSHIFLHAGIWPVNTQQSYISTNFGFAFVSCCVGKICYNRKALFVLWTLTLWSTFTHIVEQVNIWHGTASLKFKLKIWVVWSCSGYSADNSIYIESYGCCFIRTSHPGVLPL